MDGPQSDIVAVVRIENRLRPTTAAPGACAQLRFLADHRIVATTPRLPGEIVQDAHQKSGNPMKSTFTEATGVESRKERNAVAMSCYSQITYKERCNLFRLLLKGEPIKTGRARPTARKATLRRIFFCRCSSRWGRADPGTAAGGCTPVTSTACSPWMPTRSIECRADRGCSA